MDFSVVRLPLALLACIASSACSLLFGLDGYDSGSGLPDAQSATSGSSSGQMPQPPDADAGASSSSSSSSGGGDDADTGSADAGRGFCEGRVTQFCTDFDRASNPSDGFSSREGPNIFSLVAGLEPDTQYLQAIVPTGSLDEPNAPALIVSINRAPRLRFEFSFRVPSVAPYRELDIWVIHLHGLNHQLTLFYKDGAVRLQDYTSSSSKFASATITPDDQWHRAVLDLTPTLLQGSIDGHAVSLPLVDEAPDAGTPMLMRIGAPYTELVTAPVTISFDDIAVSTIQ